MFDVSGTRSPNTLVFVRFELRSILYLLTLLGVPSVVVVVVVVVVVAVVLLVVAVAVAVVAAVVVVVVVVAVGVLARPFAFLIWSPI